MTPLENAYSKLDNFEKTAAAYAPYVESLCSFVDGVETFCKTAGLSDAESACLWGTLGASIERERSLEKSAAPAGRILPNIPMTPMLDTIGQPDPNLESQLDSQSQAAAADIEGPGGAFGPPVQPAAPQTLGDRQLAAGQPLDATDGGTQQVGMPSQSPWGDMWNRFTSSWKQDPGGMLSKALIYGGGTALGANLLGGLMGGQQNRGSFITRTLLPMILGGGLLPMLSPIIGKYWNQQPQAPSTPEEVAARQAANPTVDDQRISQQIDASQPQSSDPSSFYNVSADTSANTVNDLADLRAQLNHNYNPANPETLLAQN